MPQVLLISEITERGLTEDVNAAIAELAADNEITGLQYQAFADSEGAVFTVLITFVPRFRPN